MSEERKSEINQRIITIAMITFLGGVLLGAMLGLLVSWTKTSALELPASQEAEIEALTVPEAEAEETDKCVPQAETVLEPEPPRPVVHDLGKCVVTAYCPCVECCGKDDGITATGVSATENRTVAVDPSVIPYGSIVLLGGFEYIAEDCGGAISGNRIDVFFETHAEALKWGVKKINVSYLTME